MCRTGVVSATVRLPYIATITIDGKSLPGPCHRAWLLLRPGARRKWARLVYESEARDMQAHAIITV